MNRVPCCLDLWQYETEAKKAGAHRVIGIDEAGRGPLAGPVVACALVLPPGFDLSGITDSKKLSPAAREKAFLRLTETPAVLFGIGQVDAPEIDQINILQATHKAMRLALAALPLTDGETDAVLVDGLPVPRLHANCRALVKGDSLSASIAAASIIAKVTRDRLMSGPVHAAHPQYGFASHKGYGSAVHLAALREFGPCPFHRKTFGPVAQCAFLFDDANSSDK